jgi:hypothetical protein
MALRRYPSARAPPSVERRNDDDEWRVGRHTRIGFPGEAGLGGGHGVQFVEDQLDGDEPLLHLLLEEHEVDVAGQQQLEVHGRIGVVGTDLTARQRVELADHETKNCLRGQWESINRK